MNKVRLAAAALIAFFIVVLNPVMWFYGVVADLALVALLIGVRLVIFGIIQLVVAFQMKSLTSS